MTRGRTCGRNAYSSRGHRGSKASTVSPWPLQNYPSRPWMPSLSPTTLGREATLAGSLRAHRGISTKYFLRLFCHVLLRTTFSGVVWGQLRQILRASVPWMRSVLILERTCADEVGVGRVEARLNALAADLNTACSRCCPRVSFVIARGRMTIIVPPQMQLRHAV
jgi:hypothetical protein